MSNPQEKPYVFISYAHANSDRVLPIIRAMQESGISIWFDEGIVAGSEWPEYIAEKVVNCHKFVLFVSDSYLDSQNCKREFNFAISRKKNILTVFLEDVNLSPGMEMQLGTYQALYTKRFKSDTDFSVALCEEPFFNDCKDGSGEFNTADFPKPQSSFVAPQPTYTPPSNANKSEKNRTVAILLALFLGSFGADYFYLGKKVMGILCILFCLTYIPTILGVINAIRYLIMGEEKFQNKYGNS